MTNSELPLQNIAILGASGSIGASTLAVLRQHRDRFRLIGISAQSNWQALLPIIETFQPLICALEDAVAAASLRQALSAQSHIRAPQILVGTEAITAMAGMPEVDTVVAGISGFAGLRSTWAAVIAGKRVLLANKEALVASGRLLLDAAAKSGALILPIDSEHNAVYQCAGGLFCDPGRIRAITLTASGGPFLRRELSSFGRITVAEACKHPTWSMGRKISVDSATLMNKGLEVIEAALLFGRTANDIHVAIHPSSTVHAWVEFVDRTILAHLGPADMQVPIAHALGLPHRLSLDVESLSLIELGTLEFFAVDHNRYPALPLAYAALNTGQGACLAMNAANEVAVKAFLQEKIRFVDIIPIVERSVEQADLGDPASIDEVFAKDALVRRIADAQIINVLAE